MVISTVPEKRSGSRRPQLSDLRESGSIEQEADLVLFISGEDNSISSPDQEICDMHLGKQRNGRTGDFQLLFKRNFTKFVDL